MLCIVKIAGIGLNTVSRLLDIAIGSQNIQHSLETMIFVMILWSGLTPLQARLRLVRLLAKMIARHAAPLNMTVRMPK
jgi:hypothetical protein